MTLSFELLPQITKAVQRYEILLNDKCQIKPK